MDYDWGIRTAGIDRCKVVRGRIFDVKFRTVQYRLSLNKIQWIYRVAPVGEVGHDVVPRAGQLANATGLSVALKMVIYVIVRLVTEDKSYSGRAVLEASRAHYPPHHILKVVVGEIDTGFVIAADPNQQANVLDRRVDHPSGPNAIAAQLEIANVGRVKKSGSVAGFDGNEHSAVASLAVVCLDRALRRGGRKVQQEDGIGVARKLGSRGGEI